MYKTEKKKLSDNFFLIKKSTIQSSFREGAQ